MKYNVIVETKKATADFKRECNRLQKIIDGNVRGQYTTANGNEVSRLKKNVLYWELRILEFSAEREAVLESQEEIFEQFKEAEEKLTECKVCQGAGQNTVYQEYEDGEVEAIDVVDCICTDDRWDGENQDKCLECGRIGQYFNGELKDPIGCECPYHESSNDGRLV
jgi:hypothetical protein